MTVAELIAELQKYDPKLEVAYSDDDRYFRVSGVEVEQRVYVVQRHLDEEDETLPEAVIIT